MQSVVIYRFDSLTQHLNNKGLGGVGYHVKWNFLPKKLRYDNSATYEALSTTLPRMPVASKRFHIMSVVVFVKYFFV